METTLPVTRLDRLLEGRETSLPRPILAAGRGLARALSES
jgi:hypothetical protein